MYVPHMWSQRNSLENKISGRNLLVVTNILVNNVHMWSQLHVLWQKNFLQEEIILTFVCHLKGVICCSSLVKQFISTMYFPMQYICECYVKYDNEKMVIILIISNFTFKHIFQNKIHSQDCMIFHQASFW